jgi:outer membrane immunogenic protein
MFPNLESGNPMKKQFAATFGAIILGIASGSASAADVDTGPAAYDWSGPYVGVQAGYGFGDSRHDQGLGTSGDFSIDGILGGLTAGWNHQADALVFGIEGDISAADIEGLTSNNCSAPGCESEVDWLGTVRLRGGFAMDSVLLFASGGLAVGDVSAEVANGIVGFSGDDTRIGWTVGAGVEWGVTKSLSFKFEYLFVDLGSIDYGPASDVEAEFDENHIVRAGVNWQF